jgi:hypothetical protein
METMLNDGWRFAKGEPSGFSPVTLPRPQELDPACVHRRGRSRGRRTVSEALLPSCSIELAWIQFLE